MHTLSDSKSSSSNWAGNYIYQSTQQSSPSSLGEVSLAVANASQAKALGARHAFNDIADTRGEQISLEQLKEMTLDPGARTVTVGAGVKYGELAPWLDAQGFALPNLASLPHLSIVGACATATHGSGTDNRSLASSVNAIEMVKAGGEVVRLSRAQTPDNFCGAVVGLGALGVITRITLDVVPSFQVAQFVYQNLFFDQLKDNLPTIFRSAYSVSLFTEWQDHSATQVWLKYKLENTTPPSMPGIFFGAMLQTEKLHPLAGHSSVNCTEQQGIPGPWYERLPHFRMEFTPSSGAEIQSEYFVPLERGYEAILAVEELRDLITPHLFVSELRTVAADDLWMSMAYGRDSLGVHFTWKPEPEAVNRLLPLLDARLAPLEARPHWAKVFTLPASHLRGVYPRYGDFQKLIEKYDPEGKFQNEFLRRNFPTS